MDPRAYERALSAAIRVAFGLGAAAACNQNEPPPSSPNGTNATPASSQSEPEKPKKKCHEILASTFKQPDETWYDPQPKITDPDLVRCCTQLAKKEGGGATAEVRASGCCHVAFDEVYAHCTPWGPPVPPAITWRSSSSRSSPSPSSPSPSSPS
jgi:hypothetical protein